MGHTTVSSHPHISDIAVCPGCDLVVPDIKPITGHTIYCSRCGIKLQKNKFNSVDRTLAVSLTGIIFYIPALWLPLMTVDFFGIAEKGNVLEVVYGFYQTEFYLVALFVMLTSVFLPLLKLLLTFSVSLLIKVKQFPNFLPRMLRFYSHLNEWGMLEVYLLAIMVTIIKMNHKVEISYHAGFYCFVCLVIISIATNMVLDKPLFWSLIEKKGKDTPIVNNTLKNRQIIKKNTFGRSAREVGVISCSHCNKVLYPPQIQDDEIAICPRCMAKIHDPATASCAATWAMLLCAIIFIIPANIFPIMTVINFGVPKSSTILDGIILFINEGSYFIGIIVLIASILVPLFKIISLIILLMAVKQKSSFFLKNKASMFRFIVFIGRWSLLDIFVIALLTVLFQFGFFSTIQTETAATYFSLVVISTMFATITFDPRLIWNN